MAASCFKTSHSTVRLHLLSLLLDISYDSKFIHVTDFNHAFLRQSRIKEVIISVLLRHGDSDAMLKLSARATMLRLFGTDDPGISVSTAVILAGSIAAIAASEVAAISQHSAPSSFGEA